MAALAMLAAACGQNDKPPVGIGPVPTSPKFGLTDPSNGDGVCMGDDAFAFGQTDGMGSATDVNCTAEDVEIATAVVSAYSFDNVTFTPLLPGQRIQCDPATQPIVFINTVANLQNNAQSRYDIGVWIESDPNNPVVEFTQGSSTAVTGSCTHYNLTNGSTGVSNLDADACGDMSEGSGLAQLDLDVLEVPCQDDDGDGVVEIGACIAWQNVIDGDPRVCPTPGSATSYRHGTTPNNKAKCNCDPMVLPIDIAASLDIEKQSIGGTGEFDYTVLGAPLVPFTRNTATQGNPTATSPVIIGAANFGTKYVTESPETGWTLTAINCTANGAVITIGTGQGGAFAQGATAGFDAGDNTVRVEVGTGDSPTCTFVNTATASLDIEKLSVGGTAEFDYTVSGTGLAPFTRNTGTTNPTTSAPFAFTGAQVTDDKYVTESPEAGYTLTNISCTANGAVIAIGTGQGGAFAQGATAGFDPGDNTVKVTLTAGDSPTCTFENTLGASLDIEKQSIGGTAEFDYTVLGAPLVPFTRNTAGSNPTATAAVSINPADFGVKYVTESAETGFTLTAINCTANGAVITIGTGQGGAFVQGATAGFDAGDNTVRVDVGAGDNPTCTFVNTATASLDIEKQSIGGTETFDYTVSGTGLAPFTRNTAVTNPTTNAPFEFTGAQVTNDKYVTESAETGWALTAINCTANGAVITIGTGQGGAFAQGATAGFDAGDNTVKVVLTAGDSPTCTFVNTKLALVRVIKTFNGNPITGSETFTFTLRTGASATQSGTTLESLVANSTNGGTLNFTTFLTPGATYQICEVVFAGWSSTISGLPGAFVIQTEPDGDNSTICVPFTPTPGELVVINIDNRPPPGGDARTIGYWKNWNSCSKSNGNQTDRLGAALAAAGGSILIGDLVVDTCLEAVAILNKSTVNNGKKMASDPAYNMAAQLLAARLNIAAGAGSCDDADDAMADGQALLDLINFTGTGAYKNSMTAQQQADANEIAGILDDYNNNTLCP
jgi:hypothetical protein